MLTEEVASTKQSTNNFPTQKARNVENLLATKAINVDDTVLVDIDLLKGLDNLILFSEFEQQHCGEITVSRPIAFTKKFLDNFA